MRFRSFLILLPLLLSTTPKEVDAAPHPMTMAFIDVGQGDATLIRDGNGYDILVDGGRKSAGEGILSYMQQVGVDDLEVVLATHADSDHIGGLIAVIEGGDIPVENVYYNGYPGDTQTWADFSAAVDAEGLSLIPAQFPQNYNWGSLNIQVLNPLSGLSDPDQNEASIVLLIDYAQVTALLPADVDSGVEELLSYRVPSLQAEIFKVPHHGSEYSTSQSFLGEIQPQEAIISVGQNPFGHPAFETLSRLTNTDARIWRTDFHGTILVSSDGESYQMLPRITFLPLSMRTLLTH